MRIRFIKSSFYLFRFSVLSFFFSGILLPFDTPHSKGFTTHWISSKLSDHAIIPYRIMDCIDVENRIDLVQWPVLPVFNPWQNLIRHIRNLNAKQKIPRTSYFRYRGFVILYFVFFFKNPIDVLQISLSKIINIAGRIRITTTILMIAPRASRVQMEPIIST